MAPGTSFLPVPVSVARLRAPPNASLPARTRRVPCCGSFDEDALRTALARRAAIRRTGLLVSGALGGCSVLALGVEHGRAAVLAHFAEHVATPGMAVALLCAAVGVSQLVHVEVERGGRVRARRRAPALRALHRRRAAVGVRATGDARGRGAFALRDIPRHSALGFYQGELLDNAAFFTRYPRGAPAPEYAIAVDAQHVVDGRAAGHSAAFTPAHMNHSARAADVNVGRIHQWRRRRVMFFTTRNIKAGEELLFDYGRDFWRGRESLCV